MLRQKVEELEEENEEYRSRLQAQEEIGFRMD